MCVLINLLIYLLQIHICSRVVFSVAQSMDDVDVVVSVQLLDQLLHRIPTLNDVEPQELRTWTESFTPDGKYIMGPAPEVRILAHCVRSCSHTFWFLSQSGAVVGHMQIPN